LSPLFGDSFLQPIPGAKDDEGNSTTIGQNVGAILPGSDPTLRDEYVIVSAHYDHLGVRNGLIYAGADDNASGVSMMLEVARKLSTGPKPRRSIVFIGFDLEERLLWGSRWFAAHPPWPIERVKLFITADMIGRSLGNLDLDSIFVLGSEHAPSLKHTLDEVGLPKGLDVARLGIDLVGTRSDYGPFRDREIPFLFFSSGEHPDYHSPRDVPSRIDYEQVARVSGLVLRVTRSVADSDHAPVWTSDLKPDLDEAAALNRIAKLLIKADEGDKRFSDVQRMLVSHAENKTENILKRGVMTAAERTWLIRVSQVMLFSVL
jgi:Zn-dependent M28 family amino/carboxypeptidase